MIDDFLSPDTSVRAVAPAKPPIEAAEEEAIKAKQKPVKLVRPPLPPADVTKQPFDNEPYLCVYGKEDMNAFENKQKQISYPINLIVFEGGSK